MLVRELIAAMDRWDEAGIWAFTSGTLSLLFREDNRAMLKALARHQEAGLIQRVARGLYVNPRARSFPPDVLSALVPFLRPWDFNYLSLESALSEAGWISQIPSRLTLMTTGRSQTFETPYGTLEFIHTARKPETLTAELVDDSRRELPVATPPRALRDLKRVGRNLDLVMNMEHINATSHSN
ncbi:type IV toxin-antitoxin system AbiEi family antitoxin [Cupriavidus pinatubonensis]|uniref:Transcriptional regulator, AbiEi antitoxin, Type IV TA system n=1 Tax=Cupriavidus pinatubonensis TaxID=248026 RepID=A0ABM8WQY7_9BURK|nr:hypothetical protein [Cupriavidus pinatubonensis]CAG9169821.1 hypothetical protein LMG23994_01680 [Cupriavidus pinatubonensis]